MRNDFTQVETAELADSDLDNVAGGIGVLGLNITGLNSTVSTVTGIADSVVPATQIVNAVVPGISSVTGVAGVSSL